jgi:hypothetical protein
MPALMLNKSSRVMPGFRGTPGQVNDNAQQQRRARFNALSTNAVPVQLLSCALLW